jgi:hypothetical protein
MSQRKTLSSVERLENLGKLLADEELEIVDSPEAIEATRAEFLRIAHGHAPSSSKASRKPFNAPSSLRDDVPMPWQFPNRKE